MNSTYNATLNEREPTADNVGIAGGGASAGLNKGKYKNDYDVDELTCMQKCDVIDVFMIKSKVIEGIMSGYECDNQKRCEMYDIFFAEVRCLRQIAEDYCVVKTGEDMVHVIDFLHKFEYSPNKIGQYLSNI